MYKPSHETYWNAVQKAAFPEMGPACQRDRGRGEINILGCPTKSSFIDESSLSLAQHTTEMQDDRKSHTL